MLNPFGYTTQASAAGADNDKIMQSARSNITSNRDSVIEFIAKETNFQRRKALEEIFQAECGLHISLELPGSSRYP